MKHFSKAIFLFLLTATVYAAQDPATQGRDALKRKAYDDAVSVLSTAFKASSRNAEICYLLGEAYSQKANYDSAEYFLNRSLDLNDEYTPAYISIFPVLAKKNAWDKLNKRFLTATKYDKKNPAIPYTLGMIYLEVDSLDKAILNFSRARDLDEKYVDTYIGLAEAYARQNVGAMAIANYQKAIEVAPKDPSVHYRLGKSFYKNRQYSESAKEFQEAINLDPKNDAVIYELADLYYRAKLYKEAAKFFEKYVALKPDNAVATDHYAKSMYNSKQYKDAVPVLEVAIKKNPKVFDLKPMLAHSLYVAKEHKRSADLYQSLPPDSLSLEDFIRVGRSSMILKDTVSAIAAFEKAGSLDTASAEVSGDLAAIFMAKKNMRKAVTYYMRKLKSEPENKSAVYYGAFCYSVLEKFDSAKTSYANQDSLSMTKKVYAQTLSLIDSLAEADTLAAAKKDEKYGPQYISVYRTLGVMYYQEKDYPAAIASILKALTYEPKKKDENLHLFLAQMYNVARSSKTLSTDEAVAYRDKAVAEYSVVLQINPKNATALKERKQIVDK
jgi:tetratricopeptide (TPR) repeat protein